MPAFPCDVLHFEAFRTIFTDGAGALRALPLCVPPLELPQAHHSACGPGLRSALPQSEVAGEVLATSHAMVQEAHGGG